ncbi:MAG: hypothetical protein QM755_08155 [Luteolibacter sp.]
MKIAVPLSCLAGGIAIGWFARPMTQATAAATPPSSGAPVTASATPGGGKPAAGETGAVPGKTSSGRPAKPDNDEAKAKQDAKTKEAMKKGQDQMAKRMTDIQRKKFEARLDKLAADLNLSPEQKEQVRAAMEKRFGAMTELFTDNDKDQGQKMKDAAGLLKSDGMDEATAGVLTEEQKAQYDSFKGKERQARIDSKALKDMGNIANVIEMTPEQRDGVYQALSEQAAAREDKQKSAGMMSMFTESMGIQIDDELGVQDLMEEQMEGQMNRGADSTSMADIQKTLRDTVKQRTEDRVNALRPYLNDSQLQQYRTHLETKASGMLNMFGGPGGGDGE